MTTERQPDAQGDLSRYPIPRLLYYLYKKQFLGELALEQQTGAVRGSIYFRDGLPVFTVGGQPDVFSMEGTPFDPLGGIPNLEYEMSEDGQPVLEEVWQGDIECSVVSPLDIIVEPVQHWEDVSWILEIAVNAYARTQDVTVQLDLFAFPLWLLAATVLFSIAVSVLAGVYPALRAARVDPIKALRRE